MLRRFLLIGVGGSGGKTLRYVHRELRNRLDEVGWKEEIPTAWQFLWIDVPSSPDGNEPPLPPQLPDGCYVGLAQSTLTYGTLDNSLLGSASPRLLQECAGWRPNPDHVKIAIGAGAGQHRTLGRIIALANLTRIRAALDSAHDRLTAPETTVQLARLNRALGNEDDNDTPNPVTIVVSSLAGGAGAGMYLDVCNVVRAELPDSWSDNLIALLFAPDVFEEISSLGATGVQPNGLAALSELLAGYWNNEPPGDTEFALYEPAGIPMGGTRGRGPKYPFIIGRSNSYVNFGSQIDVYAGTASALAAVLTSEAAQANLISYTLGNWVTRAGTLPDTLGLKTEMDHTPLSSLGFATVSLGRDRFGRYAAERLARLSAEHLLRAHWVGRDVPTKTKPELALEEARALSFEWFLGASGLNELGEADNDILDALAPPGAEATIDEAINEVRTQVAQHGQGAGLSTDQWYEAIRSRLDVKEPTVLANLRAASEERARSEWVPALQTRLANLTAEALARDGGPVTAALLRSLYDELGEVIVELSHEEELRRRWVTHRDSAIQSELANAAAGGRGGLVPATSEFLTRAYDKARKTIVWAAEADLRAFAGQIVRDLRENLLAPLERAVDDAVTLLTRDESPPVGHTGPSIRDWPEGNLLPRRFEPAVNERLIEPAGDYPKVFEQQILTTIGGTTAVDAIRQAVRQVVLGAATPEGQTVLRMTGAWQPARLATSSSPPARASFEIRLTAEDLLARAKEWVHQPNTAIGEHVRETLRRYLDPDKVSPSELSSRTERFKGAFTEALSLAAPLVSINAEVLQRTHGLAQASSSYSFTEIPFPEGTPGRQTVETVMRAKGVDPAAPHIQRAFGTGEQPEIDILSTLDAPFEPVVFNSIMEPIAADWTARQGNLETRKHFWKWRRSRPLAHFVPMAPAVRRSFIRGWFVARSLGQVRWTTDSEPVSVWVPEERRWLPFPFPLIGPVTATMDFLPAVLESLPLALVAAGTNGRDGAAALLPYKRLRHLGDDVGVALRPWITAGKVEEHAPAPMEDMGSEADDPTIRRKKVVEYFANLQTIYAKQIDVPIDPFNFYSIRWVWELRDDIRPILEELVSIATQTEAIQDERV